MHRNIIESLQGPIMPAQFGLCQWSGNVSLVLNELTVSRARMCISSWFQASRPTTVNAQVRDRGTDFKVATSDVSESATDGCD